MIVLLVKPLLKIRTQLDISLSKFASRLINTHFELIYYKFFSAFKAITILIWEILMQNFWQNVSDKISKN